MGADDYLEVKYLCFGASNDRPDRAARLVLKTGRMSG